jgi:hypothetical protein
VEGQIHTWTKGITTTVKRVQGLRFEALSKYSHYIDRLCQIVEVTKIPERIGMTLIHLESRIDAS